MKGHKVWTARMSMPGDPDHPLPPLTPIRVCSKCGRKVYHLGRSRGGTPWVHGQDT